MRTIILCCSILFCAYLSAQVYIVNSSDDIDDGICDSVHCSLREAIQASENDGVPSTIKFNIPGVGPFTINPVGPFPTIHHPGLTILGETQRGGPGSIQIDFNFRDFMGIGFWDILASDFYVSGIEFIDYQFKSLSDHLFQFGGVGNNASNARIYNCGFISDVSLNPALTQQKLINIFKADNLSISNCIFGSNYLKSSIIHLDGYIAIDDYQGSGVVTIDSNIFVNNDKMIVAHGGYLLVAKNIFGALDTSKNVNFLNPSSAISGTNVKDAVILDNFFFDINQTAIGFNESNGQLLISGNRFYSCSNESIYFGNNISGKTIITENYARQGKIFIDAITNQDDEIYVERNDVEDYDNFLLVSNFQNQFNKLVRHMDNRMTCINREVVSISENGPSPQILTVNGNLITGTGIPNDSLVVYFNQRIGCKTANCQGGYELGRTHCDQSGNWNLSTAIPQNSSISAFQFNIDASKFPKRYSGFSDCFILTTETDDPDYRFSNQINLFPDPVLDVLKIELDSFQDFVVRIYNSSGQLLNQFFNTSNSFEVDMSNYYRGIYYLQFDGKEFHQSKKIIKN